MDLKEGSNAPDFSLKNSEGKIVSLSEYSGKRVVLYFYPKDNTPGCTREACDFRDSFMRIKCLNTEIIGVSADSDISHKKFSEKYELPFTLLSNPEHDVLIAYGVWKQKSMAGRKYMGIERTTIIIDANGKIEKIFSKVKVSGHVDEILEYLTK